MVREPPVDFGHSVVAAAAGFIRTGAHAQFAAMTKRNPWYTVDTCHESPSSRYIFHYHNVQGQYSHFTD